MYRILKKYVRWPSADEIKKTLSESYPQKYSDTRVILGCTEFFLTKPKNCSSQAATYSQYKHHSTVKAMVGISPVGLIPFISQPYGGNSSDRSIFEKEVLNKIEPGDCVMVNRGFNVRDLLLQKGVKLYMLPFTRNENGKKNFKSEGNY